ncbi:MAG: hypothetical protein JWQ10_1423 [Herbaspirillum sp.]|jgi:hypothetical protein|nr:hypothetical protein [Herbaspirillum sp.]
MMQIYLRKQRHETLVLAKIFLKWIEKKNTYQEKNTKDSAQKYRGVKEWKGRKTTPLRQTIIA